MTTTPASSTKPEPTKPGYTPPGLSVVVPVHNEAENIVPLLDEILIALGQDFDLEVLYVNDGSTDETSAVLLKAAKTRPALRIIQHENACGQSAAVYSGVCAATKPWIAVLDGDGQNLPADLPLLWSWVATQPQANVMAIGRRAKRQDNAWRKFSSDMAAKARKLLLNDATPDSGCGLKILSRDLFLSLPYFDHMHRFMPALVQRVGGDVASIPVRHRAREHGVSKYGTLDRLAAGIFDIIGVIWLQRRYRAKNVVPMDVTPSDEPQQTGTGI